MRTRVAGRLGSVEMARRGPVMGPRRVYTVVVVVRVWFPPFAPRDPIFLLNSKEFSLAA